MDEKYRPKTIEAEMGWVVEEAGEVLAAIGKTQRWGLDSANPELPPKDQEKNGDWIARELKDLKKAINMLQSSLSSMGYDGERFDG